MTLNVEFKHEKIPVLFIEIYTEWFIAEDSLHCLDKNVRARLISIKK